MTSSAHREHARYAIELDAEVASETDRVSGRTNDISKGGFCMWTTTSMPIGTECTVRLALVFSQDEFSEQLTVPATVIWCTPRQNRFQMGVKFAPLGAQHRAYLDLFIKFLDEGGPEEEHR